MPQLSDIEVARRIRTGTIDNLYFFYGHDVASVEAYTKRLITKVVPNEVQDMNLHIFEGKSLDLGELSDVCEGLPMFSERTCITINDLDIEGLKKDDMTYLKDILSDLPDTTAVIIYSTGINVYKSKTRLLDKTGRFAAFCAKNGVACEFKFKSQSDLAKIIMVKVEKQGSSISKSSAVYLAQKTLCDMLIINNEVAKLCAYANGREITNDDIDLLCSTQVETDSFRLADAIAKGDAKRSFSILDRLYADQLDTVTIVGGISSSFVDLYRARLARDSKRTYKNAADDFSYPKNLEFKIQNAYRDCSGYKTDRLRKCIQYLSEADLDLKSSKTDSRIILEKTITKMLMR